MRGRSDRRVGRKEQIFDGGWEEGYWGRVIPLGNLESFMQQAGERQDWARVHGVLKGTNLFCYRQLEDADTGKEPLFTIAINKVMGPLVVKLPGTGAPGGWAQTSERSKPHVAHSMTPGCRARNAEGPYSPQAASLENSVPSTLPASAPISSRRGFYNQFWISHPPAIFPLRVRSPSTPSFPDFLCEPKSNDPLSPGPFADFPASFHGNSKGPQVSAFMPASRRSPPSPSFPV